MNTLAPGLRFSKSVAISHSLTVPALPGPLGAFATMPKVFATAYLVAFVEATCIDAIAPFLPPGQASVGTHVDLSHSAATPVGMTVTADVELIEVNGRALHFKVICRDDRDVICEGTHHRFIIDQAKFETKVREKGDAV